MPDNAYGIIDNSFVWWRSSIISDETASMQQFRTYLDGIVIPESPLYKWASVEFNYKPKARSTKLSEFFKWQEENSK